MKEEKLTFSGALSYMIWQSVDRDWTWLGLDIHLFTNHTSIPDRSNLKACLISSWGESSAKSLYSSGQVDCETIHTQVSVAQTIKYYFCHLSHVHAGLWVCVRGGQVGGVAAAISGPGLLLSAALVIPIGLKASFWVFYMRSTGAGGFSACTRNGIHHFHLHAIG